MTSRNGRGTPRRPEPHSRIDRERGTRSGRSTGRTGRVSQAGRHAGRRDDEAEDARAEVPDYEVRPAVYTADAKVANARRDAHQKQERSRARDARIDAAKERIGRHGRLIIVLAVIFVCLVLLWRPAQSYYVARRESEDLQAQYDQISEQNSELDEDLKTLTTEDGIKDEARKRGYVDKGETSVQVEGLGDDGGDSAAAQQDDRSTLTKVLDTIFGYTPQAVAQ